jgi:hypothetical protein
MKRFRDRYARLGFWEKTVDVDPAKTTVDGQGKSGCDADAAPYLTIPGTERRVERLDPTGRLAY